MEEGEELLSEGQEKRKFPEGFEGNFQGQVLQHQTSSGVKLSVGRARYDPLSPE